MKPGREGVILALCVSKKKHTAKKKVDTVTLKEKWGIVGDAHAGSLDREVSFLAHESISKMEKQGLKLSYGDFGENIVTEGLDLMALPIGQRLMVGNDAVVEVAKIGKTCHNPCAIYRSVGFCVMPKEGVFVRVIKPGEVKTSDKIKVLE
ncbi:MAG: MOSC domain-containing protein [Candidatus Omnitrophica bacterium]|nr:MOSC domain-containing protein [Candidatus Omnitrophota bacterium]MDD5236487.1 MOSC domain-containing protein [Candidatus Omnitrophota bacterium]MDD5611157.1 MOSC domain-containing protein [Candidatus Omnitrophota bacterium]